MARPKAAAKVKIQTSQAVKASKKTKKTRAKASTPRTATPKKATPRTATPRTATPRTATPRTATPKTRTPKTRTPTERLPHKKKVLALLALLLAYGTYKVSTTVDPLVEAIRAKTLADALAKAAKESKAAADAAAKARAVANAKRAALWAAGGVLKAGGVTLRLGFGVAKGTAKLALDNPITRTLINIVVIYPVILYTLYKTGYLGLPFRLLGQLAWKITKWILGKMLRNLLPGVQKAVAAALALAFGGLARTGAAAGAAAGGAAAKSVGELIKATLGSIRGLLRRGGGGGAAMLPVSGGGAFRGTSQITSQILGEGAPQVASPSGGALRGIRRARLAPVVEEIQVASPSASPSASQSSSQSQRAMNAPAENRSPPWQWQSWTDNNDNGDGGGNQKKKKSGHGHAKDISNALQMQSKVNNFGKWTTRPRKTNTSPSSRSPPPGPSSSSQEYTRVSTPFPTQIGGNAALMFQPNGLQRLGRNGTQTAVGWGGPVNPYELAPPMAGTVALVPVLIKILGKAGTTGKQTALAVLGAMPMGQKERLRSVMQYAGVHKTASVIASILKQPVNVVFAVLTRFFFGKFFGKAKMA